MAELLGKAAEGAIGQPCFKAVHGLAEAPDFCPHAKVLSTGQAQSTEVLEFDRTFAVSVSPIFAPDGQLVGGVHVARDITESKRAEEALEDRSAELMQAVAALEAANVEMERFTYMISHDLKSPLVTISTFLNYLEEDLRNGDTARVDKDLHFMRTAADKMGQLLSELLEMSRIGRLTNPPVEFSFQELVREVLQAVAGAIAARGVAVETQPADIMLFGDRPRLVEIWQNLVENAIKYMGEQAAPRLTLGLEQQAGEVIFSVCDNGMGIDPQYQGQDLRLIRKTRCQERRNRYRSGNRETNRGTVSGENLGGVAGAEPGRLLSFYAAGGGERSEIANRIAKEQAGAWTQKVAKQELPGFACLSRSLGTR